MAENATYLPAWFNPLGAKLELTPNPDKFVVILAAPHLHVTFFSRRRDSTPIIQCNWVYSHDNGSRVKATEFFSLDELRLVFGLHPGLSSVSLPGLAYAEKEFLNIPCMGSGLTKDPNLSIRITPTIVAAIEELLYVVSER